MAGQIRLFEKDAAGLLHQVPSAEAVTRRAGRLVDHMMLTIEVLFTAEEEAEHAAQVAAHEEKRTARKAEREAAIEADKQARAAHDAELAKQREADIQEKAELRARIAQLEALVQKE